MFWQSNKFLVITHTSRNTASQVKFSYKSLSFAHMWGLNFLNILPPIYLIILSTLPLLLDILEKSFRAFFYTTEGHLIVQQLAL